MIATNANVVAGDQHFLRSNVEILRATVQPALSCKDSLIDRHIRLVLTSQGRQYVEHRNSVSKFREACAEHLLHERLCAYAFPRCSHVRRQGWLCSSACGNMSSLIEKIQSGRETCCPMLLCSGVRAACSHECAFSGRYVQSLAKTRGVAGLEAGLSC